MSRMPDKYETENFEQSLPQELLDLIGKIRRNEVALIEVDLFGDMGGCTTTYSFTVRRK